MAATANVQTMCGLMARYQLATNDEVRAIFQQWNAQASDREDSEQFRRFLILNGYATEYQAALLSHGRTEGYFINDYKILDRLGKGRTAGVYQALSSTGDMVAIKVLAPSKAKIPRVAARF